MEYTVGDFLQTSASNHPAVLVALPSDVQTGFLVAIHEYGGDYKWINEKDIRGVSILNPYEKLSLLTHCGEWFYQRHKFTSIFTKKSFSF